jgi:hypothetical protein
MVCPLEFTVRTVACGIGMLLSKPYVLSLKRKVSKEVVGVTYHLQVECLPSPGSVPPVEDDCIAIGVDGDPRELTE